MIPCTCKDRVLNAPPRCRQCKAFRVLGLETDATTQEIKAAYYVLVKVWHPDRFEGDTALKQAAEAKLKEINSAYMFLSLATSNAGRCEQARPASTGATARGAAANTSPISKPQPMGAIAQTASLAWASFVWIFPTPEHLFKFVVITIAILLGGYAGITLDVQHGARDKVASVVSSAKDSALEVLAGRERTLLETVEQNLKNLPQ
jgi:hypothetical protein